MRLRFVRGAANSEVLDQLNSWASRATASGEGPAPTVGTHVMLLWGSKGVGKTRLLEEVLKAHDGVRLSASRLDEPDPAVKFYGIDDAQDLSALGLFTAVNTAIAQPHRLLVVGEGRPATWFREDEPGSADLKSRLSAMSVLMLDAPDQDMIVKALGDALHQVGLAIPDTTITWAAGRLRRDFGAVVTLAEEAARRSGEVRGHKALFEEVMSDNPQLCLS